MTARLRPKLGPVALFVSAVVALSGGPGLSQPSPKPTGEFQRTRWGMTRGQVEQLFPGVLSVDEYFVVRSAFLNSDLPKANIYFGFLEDTLALVGLVFEGADDSVLRTIQLKCILQLREKHGQPVFWEPDRGKAVFVARRAVINVWTVFGTKGAVFVRYEERRRLPGIQEMMEKNVSDSRL
ncbi:MAG TPA: hypothetical protein VEI47_10605 [Gemmatimonadales bacterium]|nr:hypothetical protein [Gemmatimonadales bacterium]